MIYKKSRPEGRHTKAKKEKKNFETLILLFYTKTMQAVDILICPECRKKILSKNLRAFWEKLCAYSAINHRWMRFDASDNNACRCISALEKKSFVVSRDHDNHILSRPNGLSEVEPDTYLICLKTKQHFGLEKKDPINRPGPNSL